MAAAPLVVLLRPLGLGDFLTAVPAYRAVVRAFPDHRIVLAAPPPLRPLVPLVGGIADLQATEPLVPLHRTLRRADVAFDLHGRGPASQQILLETRPGRLISFANAAVPQTAGGAQWNANEHEVARWCRMLSHAGIEADPRDLDLRVPASSLTSRDPAVTLIHPSAASEARRWPTARWAAIARAERERGRTVFITGSRAETARATEIAAGAELPRTHVLAGRTDVGQLAALVSAAGRVVSGDTGVAHLATAFRTPSVVLFGPMSPALWGPPPERPYHRALWSGKRGDPHGSVVDPGLLDISVAAVLAALATLDEIAA